MPRSETILFNKTNSRQYTDEELQRRELDAEPYKLFQVLGGADARPTFMGPMSEVWYALYRKAQNQTGSDDPSIIDDWVENQRRITMGLQGLSNQSQIPAGEIIGQSFLGAASEDNHLGVADE